MPGNPVTPFASAQVRNPFPFDLAFSMTVHKAQGRTLKRVVIDLTFHPNHYCRMVYAAVFVAMSRVKCKEHIRLLKHSPKPGEKIDFASAYKYLTFLRPMREIAPFYHGFCDSQCCWDPSLALSFQGNSSTK